MNSLATPTSKRGAKFTDVDGDTMSIHAVEDLGCFGIKFASTYREFRNTDAPAIALAILKAAGVQAAPHDSASSVEIALNHLAEHVGIHRNKAALAELTRRRDELSQHLLGECSVTPYRHASESLQMAIDMIIDLQNEAAK